MTKSFSKTDGTGRKSYIHWYGVDSLFKKENSKNEKFDSVLKKSEEITNLKDLLYSSKDEPFLRMINREYILSNKPSPLAPPKINHLSENIKRKSIREYKKSLKNQLMKTNKKISKIQSIISLKGKNKVDVTTKKLNKSVLSDSSELDYHNLSLIDRKSSIVSSLDDGSIIKEKTKVTRSNYLSRNAMKLVPDLIDKPSAETLVSFFVKEFYLKTKLNSEFELNNENIYKFCIKNDKVIYKMLKKHKTVLPNDLINLINNEKRSKKGIEMNTLKDDTFDTDLFFYTSLSSNYSNIMEEMARDITELSVFYYPLFSVTFDFVKPLNDLVKEIDELKLKSKITRLNNEIKGNKETPGSSIRWKVMDFICSAEQNYVLLELLSSNCGYWLNNILKSLFSSYSSIREESCLVLAYMLTRPLLMNELMQSKQYDVLYDMTVILLRAIERYSENISSFYCIIGYILQISSSFEIIDYIIEIGPSFKNKFLQNMWPRLLYYVLKYWPKIFLAEKPMLLRKMLDILQQMILEKKAKKMSKLTLYFLCKKFNLYPVLITVWYNPS